MVPSPVLEGDENTWEAYTVTGVPTLNWLPGLRAEEASRRHVPEIMP